MQVLAPCGWQINTAFVERINLTIRQHVAAVGRRVSTLCKGEDGLRQQLALYHVYYNFCLPHASLRLPLPQPVPTNGTGSAKQWRPLDAGDGGGADRPCLDPARGAAVSRAAVAPASGGVSKPWWWEAAQGRWPEQATCVRTAGVEGVTRGRGPLGGHEGPLV